MSASASEVARGDFCEATVGATDSTRGELFRRLFNTKTFSVNVVPEVPSVELCGALKNVVALSAGFTDGLGMGSPFSFLFLSLRSSKKILLDRVAQEQIRRKQKNMRQFEEDALPLFCFQVGAGEETERGM